MIYSIKKIIFVDYYKMKNHNKKSIIDNTTEKKIIVRLKTVLLGMNITT